MMISIKNSNRQIKNVTKNAVSADFEVATSRISSPNKTQIVTIAMITATALPSTIS